MRLRGTSAVVTDTETVLFGRSRRRTLLVPGQRRSYAINCSSFAGLLRGLLTATRNCMMVFTPSRRGSRPAGTYFELKRRNWMCHVVSQPL